MSIRLTLAALVVLAPLSAAGAFDARRVPADAAWVVHVDFEALSRSALLRTLHAAGQHVENDFDADRIRSSFGLDPFADLASMTLYPAGRENEGIVAVVVGSAKLDAAWKRVAARAEVTRIAGRDVLQGGKRDSFPYMTLVRTDDGAHRVALLATSADALERALVVLDGDVPSLASAPASKRAIPSRPAGGSLVFAASAPGDVMHDRTGFFERALRWLTEIAAIEGEERRTFARLVRGLDFDLSEARGEISLRLALDAATADDADRIEKILRAPTTALLASGEAPEAVRLLTAVLEPLRIDSPASRLVVGYRYGAERFVADVLAAEKARATPPRN